MINDFRHFICSVNNSNYLIQIVYISLFSISWLQFTTFALLCLSCIGLLKKNIIKNSGNKQLFYTILFLERQQIYRLDESIAKANHSKVRPCCRLYS